MPTGFGAALMDGLPDHEGNHYMRYFLKIITPIINDNIDTSNTAPAAMSLILPASGLRSRVTRSTRFSKAVFTSSNPMTRAIHNRMIHHSMLLMER